MEGGSPLIRGPSPQTQQSEAIISHHRPLAPLSNMEIDASSLRAHRDGVT